jgi:ribosomal protein L35
MRVNATTCVAVRKRIREARGMTAVHATDAGRMAIYLPYA